MIDVAHQNGLYVLIDIIYSHASSNVSDGLNLWDGTDYLYFHSGPMGRHSLWDSRLFNYSSYETFDFYLATQHSTQRNIISMDFDLMVLPQFYIKIMESNIVSVDSTMNTSEETSMRMEVSSLCLRITLFTLSTLRLLP